MSKFNWSFKKETFPRLKDSGSATAKMWQTIISTSIKMVGNGDIKLESTAVKIGFIDVKISSSSAANFLYNALATAFSNSIRRKIQKELEDSIGLFLEDNVDNLLDDFDM